MGRSKVQLKFIDEQRKRSATYKKRIAGLKKKASELAILCGIPVLVISFGPQGQVETWPEDNHAARHIIDRYQELSTDIRNKIELDLPGYMKAEINRHQASFNRRLGDLADTPLLPPDGLFYAMLRSLRDLGHQLDSRMEAIKEKTQLLGDRRHFNLGETMNMGSQLLEIAPCDGMMGIQNIGSGYDLMVSDPYLTMNTSLQGPPQPMSFGSGQISTDAFLQYPYVPVGMDEVPLAMIPSIPMNMDEVPSAMMPSIPMNMDGVPSAMMPSIPMNMDDVSSAMIPSIAMNMDEVPSAMMPSIPMNMDEVSSAMMPSILMNMDEVPLAMMPSIPTSSTSPLLGPISEYYSASRAVVPVDPPKSSIGLFENHNLMGRGAALQNHTNFVVAQNNMHHLGDSFGNRPQIGASPMQTSASNEPGPLAWKP
ncbi:putative MADS-box transcription factor 3 [Cocos nucifera]|uniref:Putative MADS-box transcription factor 3 n=1 Tax=Cocos nucifera TaxID=13894 RepID=A0A8K0NAH3_COCNU|nr:putative MADS-box transcription factor 3 [Cocos nucifera]